MVEEGEVGSKEKSLSENQEQFEGGDLDTARSLLERVLNSSVEQSSFEQSSLERASFMEAAKLLQ